MLRRLIGLRGGPDEPFGGDEQRDVADGPTRSVTRTVTGDVVEHGPVRTGYHELDGLVSGLAPATLNVVAGSASIGTTAFAVGIAATVARSGLPVVYFSLDATHEQLTERFVAAEARVASSKLRNGDLTARDIDKAERAITELRAVPLFIDDNPQITATELRTQAGRVLARTSRLGCVVVDYLELLTGLARGDNRTSEPGALARDLKHTADALSVPIVAISQLPTPVPSRARKRPALADLDAHSGLEHHADLVMFLHRDDSDPDPATRRVTEIIVAKHDAGPTGTARVLFLPRFARFENFAYGI